MFARFGLLDVFVTDNGPQFASVEFAVFERYHSRDILTTLRAEQRQSLECGGDAESTLCQSQTE